MSRSMDAISLDAMLLRQWPLPHPDATRSKEDRGRVLVVGGSPTVPGAALLAGEAALRAGAGKLQMGVPAAIAPALGLALPEAKVLPLPTSAAGACGSTPMLEAACARSDALLVGPGMDDTSELHALVARLAAVSDTTAVVDAGALGAFGRPHAFRSTPVLTPHAGEMASLIDAPLEEVQAHPEDVARRFATRAGAIVVLKGPETWIAEPDARLWRHTGGCSGLGTSGSGDVLAGVIAGLVARGAPAVQAAAWGVFVHGQAGEALARSVGRVGFLARELSREVPRLLDLFQPDASAPPREGSPR